MKFKPGDLIRCVEVGEYPGHNDEPVESNHLTLNKIYEVTNCHSDDFLFIKNEGLPNNKEAEAVGYYSWRFKLAGRENKPESKSEKINEHRRIELVEEEA